MVSLYRTPGVWPGTVTGLRVAVAFSDLKESELGILFRADLVLPQKGGASERRSWSNLLTYKVYKAGRGAPLD